MTFTTYAEVVTDDHPYWQAYRSGSLPTPPGRSLRDVLAETGGRYEMTIELSDRAMEDVLSESIADPGDAALAAVAQSGQVSISLENFRGLDPDNTQVVCGVQFKPAH